MLRVPPGIPVSKNKQIAGQASGMEKMTLSGLHHNYSCVLKSMQLFRIRISFIQEAPSCEALLCLFACFLGF